MDKDNKEENRMWERGIVGEGPSRNMYKGHMDKAQGGTFESGRR